MGDVTFSSAVLRGADVTIKSDRFVTTFSGRSADWPDYVDSLVSHFQGRGLGSFFTLSVHDFMSVLTHDTAQDNVSATLGSAVWPACTTSVRRAPRRRRPKPAIPTGFSRLSRCLVLVGAVNRWYPQALDIGSPLMRTPWTSRLYHLMLRSSAPRLAKSSWTSLS